MKRVFSYSLLTSILFIAFNSVSSAQTTESSDSVTTWRTRKQLTGNWGGFRTKMENRGVALDLQSTNFLQGLIYGSGPTGFEYDAFQYVGRLDLYLNLDTKKLGLWKGGGIITHFEYRFEGVTTYLGGTTIPTNLCMVLPLNSFYYGPLQATSIYYKQRFGKKVSLSVGKINTVDLFADHFFFGGYGNSGFINFALAGLPNGILQPVIMGGFVDVKTGPLKWNLMIYDPNDPTSAFWPSPSETFKNGVNYSLGTTWNGLLAGRSTSLNLTGILSTQKYSEFPAVPIDSYWYGSLMFSHLLHENANRPGNGWGLALKAGTAGTDDWNANQYKEWITGGIGGKGIFAKRPEDKFGVGYFYHHFNADPGYDTENGIEMFYNYALTPWFNITTDFQLVNPANAENKNSFSGALRASIKF
jgi:porin